MPAAAGRVLGDHGFPGPRAAPSSRRHPVGLNGLVRDPRTRDGCPGGCVFCPVFQLAGSSRFLPGLATPEVPPLGAGPGRAGQRRTMSSLPRAATWLSAARTRVRHGSDLAAAPATARAPWAVATRPLAVPPAMAADRPVMLAQQLHGDDSKDRQGAPTWRARTALSRRGIRMPFITARTVTAVPSASPVQTTARLTSVRACFAAAAVIGYHRADARLRRRGAAGGYVGTVATARALRRRASTVATAKTTAATTRNVTMPPVARMDPTVSCTPFGCGPAAAGARHGCAGPPSESRMPATTAPLRSEPPAAAPPGCPGGRRPDGRISGVPSPFPAGR